MIISRCRYCGCDYSYEGLEDPLSCGRKSCDVAFKHDVFRTEKTSTGTNIEPVIFRTGMNRKKKAKEEVKEVKRIGRPPKNV